MKSPYKVLKIMLLVAISSLFIAVYQADKAFAGYSNLPNRLPANEPSGGDGGETSDHLYINLTNQGAGEDTRRGGGGNAGLLASYIKLYSSSGNPKKMQIELIDRSVPYERSCTNYNIKIKFFPVDASPSVNGGTIDPDRCLNDPLRPGGVYEFTVPRQALRPVVTPGHVTEGSKQLYETLIEFKMVPDSQQNEQTAAFHVKVDKNVARLGYAAGANPVTIYPSAKGSSRTSDCCTADDPPKNHEISVKFKPPCTLSTSQPTTIRWKDADQDEANQGTPITSEILERDELTGNRASGEANRRGTVYGGDGQFGEVIIDVQPGYTYELVFSNIWGGNGIQIYYPYDSADFDLPCPTPDTGGDPPDISCKSYRHNLAPSQLSGNGTAVYRFTVFPKAQNYVASSPTAYDPATKSPTRSTAQGRGPWKTFNQAPVYQSGDINTGDSYNDGLGGSYSPDAQGKGVFNLNFPPPSGPDWFVYIEKWDHSKNWNGNRNPPPTNDWAYVTPGTYSTVDRVGGSCYAASCTITAYSNIGGRNGTSEGGTADVQGGKEFLVSATITNTGKDTLPSGISPNHNLSISSFGDGYAIPFQSNPMGTSIAPNSSATRAFFASAPNDVIDRGFYAYPDFYARDWTNPPTNNLLGGICSVRIQTYQRFDITPYANIDSIDKEDPRAIVYTAGGYNSGYEATVGWNSKLYRKRANKTLHGLFSDTSAFGNVKVQKTYGDASTSLVPDPLRAGDDVCAWSRINTSAGWVGPGNRIIPTEGASEQENCSTVHDAPYLRSYGADVIAGSGFAVGDTCTSDVSSGIKANISTYGDRSGSGVQFAALAYSTINGFTSASLRSATAVPRLPVGLSFGNELNADSFPAGFYKGQPTCATDFFNVRMYAEGHPKREKGGPPNSTNLTPAFKDGYQTVYNMESPDPTYQLEIKGTFPAFRDKHTIFVNGDLIITGNIDLKDFTDPTNAPSLAFIVRGNIYIDKGVTRLAGMYVAQPKADGSKGTIYTCTNNNVPYVPTDGQTMIDACKEQLIINGSFVAKNIKFLRTFKSLRDSAPREAFGECAGTNVPTNSCAAELFQFTPEIYLSPPPLADPGSSLPFQTYGSQPPIL